MAEKYDTYLFAYTMQLTRDPNSVPTAREIKFINIECMLNAESQKIQPHICIIFLWLQS